MPHGHPDYGSGAPAKTTYSIQDMAELAARLGSIDTFDRRGNVIFADDFESGIEKWSFAGSGGYSREWVSTMAEYGGFSLCLKTPAAATAHVTVYRILPYPVASRLGFEFRIFNSANWKTLQINLIRYDGVKAHAARMDYTEATHKFSYLKSDGNMADAGLTHDLWSGATLFHVIKLVADQVKDEYARLIVDNDEIDLSGKGLRVTGNPSVPNLSGEIMIYNTNSDVAKAYIDSAIFTQNEP